MVISDEKDYKEHKEFWLKFHKEVLTCEYTNEKQRKRAREHIEALENDDIYFKKANGDYLIGSSS